MAQSIKPGMSTVAELDAKLNEMFLTGKAMEAFEELYAEDVVMQENSDEPRVGKAVNRKAEEDFFASVAEFHGANVLASAVNGDVSFCEIFMDCTLKNGYHVKMSQVAVRRWKDGKIVHERFYYNKAA
jgi:ketosteroid isomerase-like protein